MAHVLRDEVVVVVFLRMMTIWSYPRFSLGVCRGPKVAKRGKMGGGGAPEWQKG